MSTLYRVWKALVLGSKRNRTQKTSQTNHGHQCSQYLEQREHLSTRKRCPIKRLPNCNLLFPVIAALIFLNCSTAVVQGQ
ncbi:hypothetical protein EUGRSUZ_E03365 [Eucalyptus grandis]|uniref:Uncharacterized protein n=2 Tax=Eucalyptus grandis TaxID=71139 RepID=A0A059C8X5_EUCGR|nr:hypothetical protein EUGRSUZ_E03365 [Eucalyptus grandis]